MFSNYTEFKNSVSSEKITLATLDAAKRLVAWTVHSGSIYKKTNQDFNYLVSVADNGTALTEVASVGAMTAGTFYFDHVNQTIYVWLTGSLNPAGRFISAVTRLHFATAPVSAPHDLNTGFDVFWEPSIESTSKFGVEIDTVNQQNEAIEGQGTLTLHNDQDFWPANFDKLFFENQQCSIYSWNRQLAITEARLLFRGKVESKSYTSKSVKFTMKDLLSSLRDVVPLNDVSTMTSYRPLPSMYQAKKRQVWGRVKGFRPVNVDNIIDERYPLTGTISITGGTATLIGTGTVFLTELSPDDRLDLNGTVYTILSVTDDDTATLTENLVGATLTDITVDILPEHRKRFINRIWSLAGHALCKPTKTVLSGTSVSLLNLSNTRDIYAGDDLYVGTLGSGTLVTVDEVVNDSLVRLSTSLPSIPTVGTTVIKPCVQDVRINGTKLLFYRDYVVNETLAIMTLRDDAEINAGDVKQSSMSATFTNGLRTVSGSGTNFQNLFYPGYVIRPVGTTTWHEILSVDSDTQMTLRTPFATSNTTAAIQFKSLIFDSESTLTCEVMGRADDDGYLIDKAPMVVKTLLTDMGLASQIDTTSFTDALDHAPETVAFAVPAKHTDKKAPTYRDLINQVGRSVFGVVYQNNDFQLAYEVLRPSIPTGINVLQESDLIDFNMTSTNKNMVKTVRVNYDNKEWDYTTEDASFVTTTSSSDISTYITGTDKEKIVDSVLTVAADAQRLADRWSFLLEFATTSIKLTTKLQTIEVEIGDILDITHRKIYERFGGSSNRKIVFVERVAKSGNEVDIEAVDLSNAFNRIAMITDGTTNWVSSSEDQRIYNGFITDSYGLINDDEASFYTNLIW